MIKFDHFNLLSPIYDLVFGRRQDKEILAFSEIKKDHRLLDVGGGTGRVTISFKEFTNHIVVADAAIKMLKQAREKNLPTVNGNSESLPFGNGSFDRIIMVDAFHHVKNHQLTLSEMWRVLAAGGRMIIEEPDINHFLVKLIAFGEKLLLMRSHFIKPAKIANLCQFGDNAKVEICRQNGIAWIVINKTIKKS